MSQNREFFESGNRVFRSVRVLCRLAILAALYVLLTTMVSIRAGNLRITFASLPVVVSALLYGPWEAATVALLGEFMNQMLTYGFTATTPLWLIPPVVRGVIVGIVAVRCKKGGRALESRPVPYYGTCIAAALATTVCNTAIIGVDGLIYHYFTWPLIFGDLAIRLFTGVITAVVVALAAQSVVILLLRQGLIHKKA